ncbi:MAG: M15 family metallopeptidase [Nitrosomonadales bacterium]|nr:M15 family metallopeptidase [Nitrosomonadales bacterium]
MDLLGGVAQRAAGSCLGVAVFSGESPAFNYPIFCRQTGGPSSLFECNKEYRLVDPVSCMVRESTVASSIETCYQAAVSQFNQYLSGVDSGTIPRTNYSAIAYTPPGIIPMLVPAGYGAGTNEMIFVGNNGYGVAVLLNGQLSFGESFGRVVRIRALLECPRDYTIRVLGEGVFSPSTLKEEQPVYCAKLAATCPIDPLPELPTDDLCAQSLEKGRGVDVDGKCPQPSDKLTPYGQLECFANKVAAANVTARPQIPYSGPSAIVRNSAYQKHLQDVWDKMIELDNLSAPEDISACQALRSKVAAEKGCDSSDSCGGTFFPGSHGIDYRPADYSNHSSGTAFDVSRRTIRGIIAELTPLPPAPMTSQQRLQFQRFVISAWLAAPTACNLVWGGSFQDPDYVHFQLP